MSISGSLETFPLPELFQIIESGRKTGRLSINPGLKNTGSELRGAFYLWFERGNFVVVLNSLKYQSLISEIQRNGWVNSGLLVKVKKLCQNQPLGTYLQQKKLLLSSQIDLLFQLQLDEVSKLFEINSAWFKFEEIDSNNKIPSDGEEFPWEEMTGKHKQATKLSLEAMRNFSNWDNYMEEMPPQDSGLVKLLDEHDCQLLPLENYLWNTANGTVPLQKIAQEKQVSLEKVQHTALSMIFAGLVEEVPVVYKSTIMTQTPKLSSQTALVGGSNVAIKSPNQSKVNNSLLNNLIGFLRNNF